MPRDVLPPWIEPRQSQLDVADEIVDLLNQYPMVILEGPTGVGKTIIGELVRRKLSLRDDYRTIHLCSSLTLQDQIHGDFPYTELLKGRSNYRPIFTQDFPKATCAECVGPGCVMCPDTASCPYQRAKVRAITASYAIFNTTYALYEWNQPRSATANPDFVIADECDLLESEILRYTELRIGPRWYRRLGLTAPPERVHYTTLARHLRTDLIPAITAELAALRSSAVPSDMELARDLDRLRGRAYFTERVLSSETWVRDKLPDGLLLKPITVADQAERLLWRHAPRWLLMSGTVTSADQMADDLGLTPDRWRSVVMPMPFPVENRPIVAASLGSMSAKQKADTFPAIALALRNIRRLHPGERVLVHTVSYLLTRELSAALSAAGERGVFSYLSARDRAKALKGYRRTPGAILLAPSLDRGVDFPADDCRVVVIPKVPYPSLGDKQVAARLNTLTGQRWYSMQTVRTMIQMTGRGVRTPTDHATTYILDSDFQRLLSKNRSLFPRWWTDAIDRSFRPARLREPIEGDEPLDSWRTRR